MLNSLIRKPLFWLSIAASISFSSASTAASCKGLDTTACGEQTSCYWVDGYQRKDGANVKAHCRAKPNKSIADKVPANSPEAAETKEVEGVNKQDAKTAQ